MRVAVRVEMVPDERVVVEHLLRGCRLHDPTQVGLLESRVVGGRHVPVDTHVAVVLERAAELVQQLRYVACQND